jgi:hypothetical protein
VSVLGVGVWVVEGRECVGGLDRRLERLVRAFVLDGDREWFVRGSQSSRTSIPFWVCGAIALLAPATTALILRRKRASEIDGAVPALEIGGVN